MRTLARLLLTILAATAAWDFARADIAVGDAFPMPGAGMNLPAAEGKVVLVDFWASWCAPCKASFPAYSHLNEEYASKGLVILAVSVDEEPKAYASFVKRYSPPFAVLLDERHELVRRVNVPTMPTCYLVDRLGHVRFIHAGYHGSDTDKALRKEVELLLSEK